MAEGDRGTTVVLHASVPAFVRDLAFDELPGDVVRQAQRCLLDLIGVAAVGSRTQAAAIANAFAATQLCGLDRDARILFDGRRAGLAGAAFAGATTIDAIDAHDGHALTKGHAGVAGAAGPAVARRRRKPGPIGGDGRIPHLSRARLRDRDARRHRAARQCADYHCSGAWNSLGCAAVVARLLAFDAAECGSARCRRIFRTARTDTARVRFADDGQRRFRLGRACRRRRGVARA